MESQIMFLDCPEFMDQEGTVRCGLPAEVKTRYTMTSTDGPLESAMIRCPSGHFFNGPIESLVWEQRRSVRRTGQEVAPGTQENAREMTNRRGSADAA